MNRRGGSHVEISLLSSKPCCQPFPRMLTSQRGFWSHRLQLQTKNMSDGNNLQQMEREFVAGSEEPPQYRAVCRPVISALNSPF